MADHAHKLLALYYTAKKIDVSLRYRRALIASSLPNLGLDKARPHLDGALPNRGQPLSSEEMYLLLAGIYLHDIGMQCDVVKYPEIRARAEKLGAQFDTEFTALTSSGYSIEEQKSVRKNHHYLTAAWIDHAYRTGDTVLGPAAKTIPRDLVTDLMDVCKYHARLPITECPSSFRFDPTQRKRFVAALVRFADELDVDANRVAIETVKAFRLDPSNSVYWWLHGRTKVIFSAPNLILLTVFLHSDDVKLYGSLVFSTFIIGFQTKNRPVLSALAHEGIPLVISADSKVIADEYAEPLPIEIAQALQARHPESDPPISLTEEVRLMQEFTETASKMGLPDHEGFWRSVDSALDRWRRMLNVEYVAFFSGQTETDTILTLKASAGLLPRVSGSTALPHFNWREAGLSTGDGPDTQKQEHDWMTVSLADRERLSEAFRGGADAFSSCAGLIPARLPGGPFGILVVGHHLAKTDLADHGQSMLMACRDFSIRILLLQLTQILKTECSNWEKTSQLIAHRVRTSVQDIMSQLKTLNSKQTGELGFTTEDQEQAQRDLEAALRGLAQLSYISESNINTLDVAGACREFVPLGEVVWAAVADKHNLAKDLGVEIVVSQHVLELPIVYVNGILMRLAFANLIDNGLRFTYPRPDSHERFVCVEPGLPHPGEAKVKVISYGLGIKREDQQRIFEWGVRRVQNVPNSREAFGKGIGLWEVRHIVEGHGGRIDVSSVHTSGKLLTNSNIQQCMTTFTISLPIGKGANLARAD